MPFLFTKRKTIDLCWKMFETLCQNMFLFLTKNNLIHQNQSGFKTGDSCIEKLL